MTTLARVRPERPALSPEGRILLRRRFEEVKRRIAELEEQLASWPEDPHTEAALAAVREEASRIGATLAAAVPLEEVPDDPQVVEVGDTVTLRRPRSRSTERFTIVNELEARLDDSWISEGSPLAVAVLGRRRGEVVEVRTPDGSVGYRIVDVQREGRVPATPS